MAIFDRAKQLRYRRYFRMRRRRFEESVDNLDDRFEHDVLNRIGRLSSVWRFVAGWLGLMAILAGITISQTFGLAELYQKELPVSGGVYNEGIIGTFSNASPLFASSAADNAVSRLVFSGLMKYDDNNQLVEALADRIDIDNTSRNYTIHLRPELKWQDGKPLTADDVVFTYKLIQNPDVKSPLRAGWSGVNIEKVNKLTIRLSLPNALAPFKYSLTTGILPEHLLKNVPATQIRSSDFNQKPIGAGPYKWVGLDMKDPAATEGDTSVIALEPFINYFEGKPKLDRFLIHTYNSEQALANAFKEKEVIGASGLTKRPEKLGVNDNIESHTFNNTAEMMVFFKTTEGVLNDIQVRRALALGVNRINLAKHVSNVYRPLRSVLLPGQIGYDKQYDQPQYNLSEAKKVLESAGWKVGSKGVRYKENKPLIVRIYAEDTELNRATISQIKSTWLSLGVDLKTEFQQTINFQTTLNFHTYDALLYGISIGADPDVYAYWHSSQADVRAGSRLNFSEYKSAVADKALEAGRARLDPEIRTVKYQPFLKAWAEDTPAVALYQPKQLYFTRGAVYGLNDGTINTDADRYNNVANWQIHTAGVTQ